MAEATLVRPKTETRSETFRRLIAAPGTYTVLLTQVDPDAIGAGLALATLVERFPYPDRVVRIAYCGEISHPQNWAIHNQFGLGNQLQEIQWIKPRELGHVLLVDSSSCSDRRIPEAFRPIDPVVVIDHHECPPTTLPGTANKLLWIESVGAASTLVYELGRELNYQFRDDLALLLALGIYTDTHELVFSQERDRQAFDELTHAFRRDDFVRLVEYEYPPSHFEHLRFAAENCVVTDDRLVTGLGLVNKIEADDIAMIANLYARRRGISLVVVWGVVEGRIRICARSTSAGFSLGQFLRERFGPENSGAKVLGNGRSEGGATLEFNLGVFQHAGPEAICKVVHEAIKNRVFAD